MPTMDPGRRAHYAEFYDGPPGDEPLALVHGNCQAGSLRVLLACSPTFPYRAVRMPPVHELTADDLPALHALLPRTALLVSQPIRDDYRDLPLGTAQLAVALPRGAQLVRWPVIRYAGLHPYTVIVRHPSDMSADPPVVPYHDLRTLAVAAGVARTGVPGPAELRAAAEMSIEELACREQRSTDVGVSDVLAGLGAESAHTLNHPGNPVLVALARRVQHAAGLPVDAVDPGRVLLGGIRAPLEAPVVAALGLAAAPRPHWLVEGTTVEDDDVRSAQLDWYATHAPWVEAGLRRHADRMALLAFKV